VRLFLLKAFHEDMDIHSAVASAIYGELPENVSTEMRRNAKAINFGIIYGLNEFGLSRDTGLSVKEATRFINAYFDLYKGVRQFRDKVIEETKKCGYIKTLFLRKRSVPDINSTNKKLKSLAERIAINTVIQGSAADLIKVAMNKIHMRLQKENYEAHMLLQIHDELLFEVKENKLEQTRLMVQEEMGHAVKLKVPVKVNIKTGKNWMET